MNTNRKGYFHVNKSYRMCLYRYKQAPIFYLKITNKHSGGTFWPITSYSNISCGTNLM